MSVPHSKCMQDYCLNKDRTHKVTCTWLLIFLLIVQVVVIILDPFISDTSVWFPAVLDHYLIPRYFQFTLLSNLL